MSVTKQQIVWTLLCVAGVLAYLGAHTSMVPVGYAEMVKDWGGLVAFVAAFLRDSPMA